MDEAKDTNSILVIDEIHTFRGTGTHRNSSVDFFDFLKTEMSDGTIRVIGTTTSEEYQESFAGDEAVRRRMPEITRPPVTDIPGLVTRLKGWAKRWSLEQFPDPVLEGMVGVALQYDAVSTALVKCLRLAEEMYADAKLTKKDPREFTLENLHLSASRLYGIDSAEFSEADRDARMKKIEEDFSRKVIGLPSMRQALIRETSRILDRTNDPYLPRVRFFLAGPKGLGKTHIAKSYADAIGRPFVRIMMSRINTADGVDELMKKITSALRKNAFTVFLFDEIEKAPLKVQSALLDVMDSDHITVKESLRGGSDSRSTFVRVNTAGATLLFATNAGQESILRNPQVSSADLKQAMIADGLSEFLVDRAKKILAIPPPATVEEFKQVLHLFLDEYLSTQTKQQGETVDLVNREAYLTQISSQHFKANLSYREIIEEIKESVADAIGLEKRKGPELRNLKSCEVLLQAHQD